MTYSVAIRTLGTSGEKFQRELISLHCQTILAERILVYIAEGFVRPEFQIGREEYIWVKKGMMAQRALSYHEISSDCLLLLDDDVELAPDSVEKMLTAMATYHADCVGADTFRNQDLPLSSKLFAGLTNWVFPHTDKGWAFKIHRYGSFSYLNCPKNTFYWSQSCAGPCSLWKKSAFLSLHIEDELWLDRLGFPYGEDMLTFYKLHKNGYKLGILYNSGVKNLDGQSSSGGYHSNVKKFYTRSKGAFLIWWRCCYSPDESVFSKMWTVIIYSTKCLWLLLINSVAMFQVRDIRVLYYYVKGIWDAIRFICSPEEHKIPPYILTKSRHR